MTRKRCSRQVQDNPDAEGDESGYVVVTVTMLKKLSGPYKRGQHQQSQVISMSTCSRHIRQIKIIERQVVSHTYSDTKGKYLTKEVIRVVTSTGNQNSDKKNNGK